MKRLVLKDNYIFKTPVTIILKGTDDDIAENTEKCTITRLLSTGQYDSVDNFIFSRDHDIRTYAYIGMNYGDDIECISEEEAIMSLAITEPEVTPVIFTEINAFAEIKDLKDIVTAESVLAVSDALINHLQEHEPEALIEVEIENSII